MRRKLIPEQDIINLTKQTLQSFYNRDISEHISYLSDDFVWIGAFDFQYTKSKGQFLEVINSEIHSSPFKMIDEKFSLLSKSSTTYIVCGKFKLVALTEEDEFIRTHTRVTVIWQYIKNELKLTHVHGSNSQDIPFELSDEFSNLTHDKDFFTSITSLNLKKIENKLRFRDIGGSYRYFMPNEIIYLKSNLQNTFIVTNNECIEISGLLLTHSKILPEEFYRIHKSYIINTSFVHSLERYKVTLINDIKLPVSKEKFIAFREFCKYKL